MKSRESVLGKNDRAADAADLHADFISVDAVSHRFYSRFLKRAIDLIFALAALPIIFPVFMVLYFVVRSDGGPFLFRHSRIGRNGQSFGCLKIRTMAVNAERQLQELLESDPQAREEWQSKFKLREDPRITRVGQLLRKTSLDEMPQLFNVLSGQMSVVGPRPITAEELERYGELAEVYKMVRPGLTGRWQISGRRDNDFASRAQQDAEYVAKIGFWSDMYMLVATIPEVVFGRGR